MARTHPFLERLGRGPILCDGAMGTQLYERGIPYDRCFDALNLSYSELIKAIHLDYIAAGAEIIQTNTFGANRFRLAEHNLTGEVSAINRAGRTAREARDLSEQQVFLAGQHRPDRPPLEPLGSVDVGRRAPRSANRRRPCCRRGWTCSSWRRSPTWWRCAPRWWPSAA